MRVIEHVLILVEDHSHLGPQMQREPAVEELVRGYNHILVEGAGLMGGTHFAADSEMSGLEFKRNLSCLTEVQQMRLLEVYLNRLGEPLTVDTMRTRNGVLRPNVPEDDEPESEVLEDLLNGSHTQTPEAKRDARRLRHWLIKAGVICGSVLVCVLIGAVTAMMVANKTLPSNEIISKLMTTIVEVAKLLFTNEK